MSEIISGNIVDLRDGILYIKAAYDNTDRFIKRKYDKVRIELEDGRSCTDKQRRMCYAMIGAIADWSGEERDQTKEHLKLDFLSADLDRIANNIFSLSNGSESLVREFQKYLVKFIISNDIPVKRPLLEFVDDINDYVYQCVLHKKCAVCGKHAELHHVDAVGMGNNRNEIVHGGLEVMSLCRIHHGEAHQIGNQEFMSRYHLNGGVNADKSICKLYGIKEKKA